MLTWLRIIAASLALIVLGGCSAVRLGYSQAHNALYWWIDGYADMNDAQSTRMRTEIDRFMAWHAQSELPAYRTLLRRWQASATSDTTATAACQQYEALRQAWGRMATQGAPALAALALQLDASQMAHAERHLRKGHEGFEKDFVQGTPAQRLARRVERLTDRYETLYGPLTAAQQAMVRQDLAASPFRPEQALQDRRAHGDELLQMIRQWQAMPDGPDRQTIAQRALSTWLSDRLPASQTDKHPTAAVIRHGCEQYARLHNSTTATQRRHAAEVLASYEADIQSLIPQD